MSGYGPMTDSELDAARTRRAFLVGRVSDLEQIIAGATAAWASADELFVAAMTTLALGRGSVRRVEQLHATADGLKANEERWRRSLASVKALLESEAQRIYSEEHVRDRSGLNAFKRTLEGL